MDETDDSRGGARDAGDWTRASDAPDATDGEAVRDGDGPTGYDRETVASTVEDAEGIEYDDGGGNIAGASPGADLGPVEPGSPTLEGALFVLLGIALTIVVLAQLVGF